MPAYLWKARTRQGTIKKGEIEAATLALDFIKEALGGAAPKRVVVVPGRIVNVVV